MPIYAYRCGECGHQKDVLQKVSDPPLRTCPACGAEAFAKQLTAAGFQLKGSGWYATDFKGNGGAKAGDAAAKPSGDKAADSTASGADAGTSKPAAAPAQAGASGGSCASH